MILVDSSVWIDYFRGKASVQADLLGRLLGEELVAIGDLMLVEILQGFGAERDFQRANKRLRALLVVELGGRELAVQAVRNFRLLRARGASVRGTIDTIIATRCISDDIALLYSDRDFDPFVQHLGLRPAMAA